MSDHLSQEQITRYRERLSPPAELLQVDRHMAECDECRARLAAALGIDPQGRGLAPGATVKGRRQTGEHPAAEMQHLTYEQLEACVDGALSRTEREALLTHTHTCRQCAEELQDLERFKVELPDSARARTQTRHFPLRLFATAAAVVLAVVAVLIWQAPPRRPADTPSGLDGASASQETGASPLERGTAALSTATRQAVGESVRTGIIALPRILAELRGDRETLRGGADASDGAVVLEPRAEVVLDPQPAFQWRPVTGVTGYSVAIFDLDARPVQTSPLLHDTQWKPTSALERGRSYQWQVTARMSDGTSRTWPASPAPQARFAVAAQSVADELEEFNRHNPDEHLVLGILYARAGILTQAQIELRRVTEPARGRETAQKLLRQLYGWTG